MPRAGGPSPEPRSNGPLVFTVDRCARIPYRKTPGQAMTPDEFRDFGHRLIDWVADYRATLEHLPVMARTTPGQIRSQFPASAPEMPEDFGEVFHDLERI